MDSNTLCLRAFCLLLMPICGWLGGSIFISKLAAPLATSLTPSAVTQASPAAPFVRITTFSGQPVWHELPVEYAGRSGVLRTRSCPAPMQDPPAASADVPGHAVENRPLKSVNGQSPAIPVRHSLWVPSLFVLEIPDAGLFDRLSETMVATDTLFLLLSIVGAISCLTILRRTLHHPSRNRSANRHHKRILATQRPR